MFQSGTTLIRELYQRTFDLLILDLEVPDLDGREVLSWTRTHLGNKLPILFLTHYGSESEVVNCLSAGADDHMTKPIRASELTARVNALLRRSINMRTASQVIEVGVFRIDSGSRTVSVRGEPVDLTPKEFDIALLLFRHVGSLIPRDHIMHTVWAREATITSRTMDTHMSRVRIRLGLKPENGVRLVSVYTHGYRLEVLDDSAPQGTT
jgi:DNA-binding response OmpR family regulator